MGLNFGENVVENEEVVGGGWSADESFLGKVILEECYFTETKKGSTVMNLATANQAGDKRTYQLVITNAKGDTFYDVKDKGKPTGEKRMLPNYQIANSICYATAGKSFQECYKGAKKKVIDVMDWESRKNIPTEVMHLPMVLKKAFKIGVIKVIKNKWKGGKATNEKQEVNEIQMVFNKDGFTSTEVRAGATETKKQDAWEKYWIGRVKDTFKEVEEDEDDMPASEGADPFGDTSTDSDSGDAFGDADASDEKSEEKEETKSPEVTDADEEDPFA